MKASDKALTSADALIRTARAKSSATVPGARRAALYLRQSPTRNGEDGIERQRERTTALASSRGWRVVSEYVDLDVSASKTRGKGTDWARMLTDRSAGLIDVVIAVDLDRLLRSTRDLNALIDAGLMAVTVDGEIDLTTADGEFRATMLAGIARFEVRRKGERQSRANQQRAERGGVPKGTRCTGYNTDGTVREDEAETVRALFNEFAQGDTLRTLSRRYELTPSSVRTILTNPRYAGRRTYKGKVVGDGSWTALVDPVAFDLVNARLADPRRKTNATGTTARKYLGSGLFRCACGDTRRIVSGGSGGTRYTCRGCYMTRNREAVDQYVLAVLAARLRQPDALAALRPGIEGRDDAVDLLAEHTALRERLTGLAALVADGTLTPDDVREAVEPLRARLADVETALAEHARTPVLDGLEGVLDKLDEAWPTMTTDRQRALVSLFMTVTLHRAQQGRKGFDPETVTIDWTR
ncbi:site-specific recombinase DNA invertase Pin [Nocardioides baekrokdamisoli]|uniref:Site-specific recombinase DNA invertase Pin n=1 Tax=Nocardioides baekrokdamisoli TaxID=1804624 RepID=A0A3G9IEL2_9ACTN|nr:recombinase family protein [Nocardioides baekrokdamisoli]BBH16796.1 site-specific recombinase DNA invertase Pin [Nocardioides baekrokdamisoli]